MNEHKIIDHIAWSLKVILGVPLVLSFSLVVLALCAVDLAFFVASLLGILKLLIPTVPINIGLENIVLNVISICFAASVGYYLYQYLRVYVPQYFNFLGCYFKNLFTKI